MTNFEYILEMKGKDFDMLVLLLSDLVSERNEYDGESTLALVEDWLNKEAF